MQKVVGSNPISRLPRLTRPAGRKPSGRFQSIRRRVPCFEVRTVVLWAVLVALVVSGCGGGSSPTAPQHETRSTVRSPSRADYIELADTICANHRSRREDLESQARDLGPIDSRGKAHRIADLLRRESKNRLAETRELEIRPPTAGEDSAGAPPLSLLRAQARLIERWARAYDDLDFEEIRGLQRRLGALVARTRDSFRAYGFKACGQD